MSSALTLNPNIEKYFFIYIFFRESPKDKIQSYLRKMQLIECFRHSKSENKQIKQLLSPHLDKVLQNGEYDPYQIGS